MNRLLHSIPSAAMLLLLAACTPLPSMAGRQPVAADLVDVVTPTTSFPGLALPLPPEAKMTVPVAGIDSVMREIATPAGSIKLEYWVGDTRQCKGCRVVPLRLPNGSLHIYGDRIELFASDERDPMAMPKGIRGWASCSQSDCSAMRAVLAGAGLIARKGD